MPRGNEESGSGKVQRLDPGATKKETFGEQVYAMLRQDILRGALKPGEKLHFHKLKQEYGFGIDGLRYALSRLAAEGLVIAYSFRGFSVAPVSVAEMDEILQLRLNLDCRAVRRSIERGDIEWEASLTAALYKLKSTPPIDPADTSAISIESERRHQQFHHALRGACDWPHLLGFCEQLEAHAARYRSLSAATTQFSRDVNAEHDLIVQAALSRNADKACALLSHHYILTAENLRERLLEMPTETEQLARSA